jgi:diguanylate cyclase (GGDEF)-like protein
MNNELSSVVSQLGIDTFLEHTNTIFVLMNEHGELASWNRAFEMFAKNIPQNSKLDEFIDCQHLETFKAALKNTLDKNERVQASLTFIANTEDGPSEYECILTPVNDGQVLLVGEQAEHDPLLPEKYYRLSKLVNQLRVDYEQVKKILIKKQAEIEAVVAQAAEVSHTDVLTYLPNRRQGLIDLQRETIHAERYKTPFTVSILDVDHFKKVNDTYGHAAGDNVLKFVADVLREYVRTPDIAVRFGGEEFLILLPNSGEAAAAIQAQRLCDYLRKTPCHFNGVDIHITASIGIAQYDGSPETWQNLLHRADKALYDAKNNGRDQYVLARS